MVEESEQQRNDRQVISNEAQRLVTEIFDRSAVLERSELMSVNRDTKRECFLDQTKGEFHSVFGQMQNQVQGQLNLHNGSTSLPIQQEINRSVFAGTISGNDLQTIRNRLATSNVQYPPIIQPAHLPAIIRPEEEEPVVVLQSSGGQPGSRMRGSTSGIQTLNDNVQNNIPMNSNPNSITEARKLEIRQRLNIPVNDKFDDGQFQVANAFMNRFSNVDPNPLKLLILGGPGSGKTWIINLCSRLTEGTFTYTTIGGSAASNLREGMTSCNAFGFVPGQRGKNAQQDFEMEILSETNQPMKLLELQERFRHRDATLVFDEISQAPILHIAHINNRCNEIKPTLNQVKCGDFNQIPGVGLSIPNMIEAMLIHPESIDPVAQRLQVEAANDFMQYRLIRLTQQNRTQDEDHLGRIKRIVDYSQAKPISEDFIRYLQSIQLKQSDIDDASSPWLWKATVLVASNAERFFMNRLFGELYIKAKEKVGFYWSLKGVGTSGSSTSSGEELTLAEIQALCQRYPELCGYFMEGAPATLVENLKPSKGLSNGTQCFMNSLRFDTNHPKYAETKALIENAKPGDMVYLPLAPSVRTLYFVDVKFINRSLNIFLIYRF